MNKETTLNWREKKILADFALDKLKVERSKIRARIDSTELAGREPPYSATLKWQVLSNLIKKLEDV